VRLLGFSSIRWLSPEPRRCGNPGYGRLKALRVLVYSRLKELENDTRIVEHLKKHRSVVRAFGLPSVPDRTTIGRWWRRYVGLLEEVFEQLSNLIQILALPLLLFHFFSEASSASASSAYSYSSSPFSSTFSSSSSSGSSFFFAGCFLLDMSIIVNIIALVN